MCTIETLMMIRVGTVEVRDSGIEEPARGLTLQGQDASGSRRLFVVTDRAGLKITLSDFRWQNGERHVGVTSCEGPPQIIYNLVPDNLRLGVLSKNRELTAALSQARVKLNTERFEASLHPANNAQLDEATGVSVARTLASYGARTTTDRGRTHVTFADKDHLVPVLAFVLTRVLPLKNMAWARGTNTNPRTFELKGTTHPDGDQCYVIALDPDVASDPARLGSVYVGQTGVMIQQRFRQHKLGYKSGNAARKYGIRLMPELFEDLPPIPRGERLEAERDLRLDLENRGYQVSGATELLGD